LNLIHTNIRSTYNRHASICLSTDDISKGTEFPEEIVSDIQMKGLEFYFAKEKKELEQQQSAQGGQAIKQLQTDMQGIKKARPIQIFNDQEEEGGVFCPHNDEEQSQASTAMTPLVT
jgi:hypothetical protein